MSVPRHEWRARTYRWAQRAIAAAEAVHGPPVSVCRCGQPLPEYRSRNPGGQCEACQPDSPEHPARQPGRATRMADA